jgi:hydroxymethylglutaryl-CoA lyase
VLTPNLQGFDAALAAGAREVAVFAAASESFSQRNIQCSIADSLARFAPVLAAARQHGVAVRGYVSCVLGCHCLRLLEMGCTEISLGDTIGVGTPAGVRRLLDALLPQIPASQLAGHFHDTYGMAIANIVAAMECGLATFDSSVAGLGGCPYAQGASGNVATEDVVWLLNGLGVECGVSLEALLDASALISGFLGKPPASRVARALLAKRGRE